VGATADKELYKHAIYSSYATITFTLTQDTGDAWRGNLAAAAERSQPGFLQVHIEIQLR
jgi:hypothetical protein